MGFIEWWGERPKWLRWCFPVVLLLISTVLERKGVIWPWGWIMGGLLILMNLFVKSDDNEML